MARGESSSALSLRKIGVERGQAFRVLATEFGLLHFGPLLAQFGRHSGDLQDTRATLWLVEPKLCSSSITALIARMSAFIALFISVRAITSIGV